MKESRCICQVTKTELSAPHLSPDLVCPLGGTSFTVWGGVGWGGVVWCGVVWCGVVWCGVVWCGVVWCGVVWCGVVWCGVVWCGVVWCGVVWCGVVWCGVVWCGVVWCGVCGEVGWGVCGVGWGGGGGGVKVYHRTPLFGQTDYAWSLQEPIPGNPGGETPLAHPNARKMAVLPGTYCRSRQEQTFTSLQKRATLFTQCTYSDFTRERMNTLEMSSIPLHATQHNICPTAHPKSPRGEPMCKRDSAVT